MGSIAERATITVWIGPTKVRAEANGMRHVGSDWEIGEFALHLSRLAGI
jgi:hypothetical protein